jgi:hypothetical protein
MKILSKRQKAEREERVCIVQMFREGKTMREIAVLFGREPWEVEAIIRPFVRSAEEE